MTGYPMVDQRSGLNAEHSSAEQIFGCFHAA